MTGICFANILKFKEFDKGKPSLQPKNPKGTPGKEEEKKEEEVKAEPKNPRLNYGHQFASRYLNKVMMSTFAMEFFNFDPTQVDE